MRTLMGDVIPPALELRVEIVDVAKGPRRKERVAQVADLALDFALGESRRLRSMRMIRIESSASPIRSTH